MTDTSSDVSFYVILDSNIWRSENFLQSAMGSALLYAVSGGKAAIVLPEIVELEVNNVMYENAKTTIAEIQRKIAQLGRLPGDLNRLMTFVAPDPSAVEAGVKARWEQLHGVITRVGFTYTHARQALDRILAKRSPSGQNNEQFRDCCIWEVTLEMARDHPVHLITNDSAFYVNRDSARSLEEEANQSSLSINLYRDIAHFLSGMKETISTLGEAKLASQIVIAVVPLITETIKRINAGGRYNFVVANPSTPQIQGFSTLKPNILAVSFKVSFGLQNLIPEGSDATLTIEGTCAYDAQNNDGVSEIEIDIWRLRINGYQHSWSGTSWQEPGKLESMFSHVE